MVGKESNPMGIGDPENLTGAVVLLCSEAGRFITGSDFKIDGSLSCLGIGVSRLTTGVRLLYTYPQKRCFVQKGHRPGYA